MGFWLLEASEEPHRHQVLICPPDIWSHPDQTWRQMYTATFRNRKQFLKRVLFFLFENPDFGYNYLRFSSSRRAGQSACGFCVVVPTILRLSTRWAKSRHAHESWSEYHLGHNLGVRSLGGTLRQASLFQRHVGYSRIRT